MSATSLSPSGRAASSRFSSKKASSSAPPSSDSPQLQAGTATGTLRKRQQWGVVGGADGGGGGGEIKVWRGGHRWVDPAHCASAWPLGPSGARGAEWSVQTETTSGTAPLP
eukprot:CAMPEP_0175974836 /NCGR_PEP_ID=MMETSP0108-20121206/43599_1 /TAXON_ID=195067 ORGANISM="Goniomonas pacifica, Strain CCMP1869" /NCGR_SAMPLE_ID=MMETSP0108 /ASSEMBLY_ACC=CAM_ASM_000204 /LENGTH=110 /DNA_ID=CAMNT_0017304495 /DNA_START=903 /DNA_END=1236 /DNA_ORIENTATION=-